jgi:cytoskeletal protein RodZ
MADQRHHPDPHIKPLEAENLQPAGPIQAEPMPDRVARILREAREAQSLSLHDVAAVLNIRYAYLQAIEDGEFGKLPGTTYAIGFLRSYAGHLGLDSADLVNSFKAEVAALSKRTQLVFPTPVPEGKVPGGALILVSVLFLALAYGAWSYFSGQDEQVADVVPVVPERLQDLLEVNPPSVGADPASPLPTAQAETPAGKSADGEAAVADALLEAARGQALTNHSPETSASSLESAPFETAPIGPETAPAAADAQILSGSGSAPVAPPPQADVTTSGPTAPATPPAAFSPEPATDTTGQIAASPAPETPAPEAIPAAPPAGETAAATWPLEAQVYGRGNLEARIVLRATQDAWVQVRDGNEDLLFTRVLRAGDSYRVPNQAGLTLLTGNAGGLDVTVDGMDLGPLGSVGSVRRNVILEPDRLRDGVSSGQ